MGARPSGARAWVLCTAFLVLMWTPVLAHNMYYRIEADKRRCAPPLCGGYYVTKLNAKAAEKIYVATLDTPPTLNGSTYDSFSTATKGLSTAVVAFGRILKVKGPIFNGKHLGKFVAESVYLGLPGIPLSPTAPFFSLSKKAGKDMATLLNAGAAPFRVSAKWSRFTVAADNLDSAFQKFQLQERGALLQAAWRMGSKNLAAVQVFFKLPVEAGPCPVFKLAACPPEAPMRTYERDGRLCLLPHNCMKVDGIFCTESMPVCSPDYTLSMWQGPKCPMFVCDPNFIEGPKPVTWSPP